MSEDSHKEYHAGRAGHNPPQDKWWSEDYQRGKQERDQLRALNAETQNQLSNNVSQSLGLLFKKSQNIAPTSSNNSSNALIFFSFILFLMFVGFLINKYEEIQKAKILAEKREYLYKRVASQKDAKLFTSIIGSKPEWYDFFNFQDKKYTIYGEDFSKIDIDNMNIRNVASLCYYASYFKTYKNYKYIDKNAKLPYDSLYKKLDYSLSNNIKECFVKYEVSDSGSDYVAYPFNFSDYFGRESIINFIIDIIYQDKRIELYNNIKKIKYDMKFSFYSNFIFGETDSMKFYQNNNTKMSQYLEKIEVKKINNQDSLIMCKIIAFYVSLRDGNLNKADMGLYLKNNRLNIINQTRHNYINCKINYGLFGSPVNESYYII
jgi:hypothetical protein